MEEINLPDIIEIVLSVMGVFSASGNMMRKGVEFFDTPHEIIIDYNTSAVPYIIYQEEGFTHYLSGKFINVNQGFISKKTKGQLSRYGWSKALGIPFNKLENDQILLENQSKLLEEVGATYEI